MKLDGLASRARQEYRKKDMGFLLLSGVAGKPVVKLSVASLRPTSRWPPPLCRNSQPLLALPLRPSQQILATFAITKSPNDSPDTRSCLKYAKDSDQLGNDFFGGNKIPCK